MNKPSTLTQYEPRNDEREEILSRFQYHAPHGDQVERYGVLRSAASDVAELILMLCPPSRERSSALTRLEEAIMHANASIARNEPHPDAEGEDLSWAPEQLECGHRRSHREFPSARICNDCAAAEGKTQPAPAPLECGHRRSGRELPAATICNDCAAAAAEKEAAASAPTSCPTCKGPLRAVTERGALQCADPFHDADPENFA